LALRLERVGRAFEVLANRDELTAGVESDDVAREHTEIYDVGDDATLHVRVGRRCIIDREELHLLGSHRDAVAIALQQIRDSNEAGDELRRRALVTSTGVPSCSIRPRSMTATRSLIVSASSWSCVT